MAKPSKASKFFKTLLTILMVLIIVITIGINVLFLKPSSAPFNSIYIMQQTDMNDVKYGDAVISSPNKVSELQPGNVVLCLTSPVNDMKEVLKLIDITQEDGTTYYYVRSDQQTNDDALKLTQDKILAKCLWTNSVLGSALNFAKSIMGIVVLIALPCLVLLIMKISSTIAEHQESKQEEELRKNTPKKTKKQKSTNTEDSTHDNNNEAKKKQYNSSFTTEVDVKPSNKSKISVKQLSEEESIQQRNNVSNMVGSELSSGAREITREFNSAEINVSHAKHVNAVRLEEDAPIEESVHSPNMNEKADKIRKALSNNNDNIDENTTKPTMAVVSNDEPVKSQPAKSSNETKVSQDINKIIENPVIIVPEKPNKSEPVQHNDTKPKEPSIESPIKVKSEPVSHNDDITINDNFLDNIIDEINTSSSKSKVSDDFLDEILNSIPSTQPTREVKRSVPTTERTVKRSVNIPKVERHVQKSSKTTRTNTKNINSKVVDNTPFDELIKAIEKEKNGIK